MVMLVRPVQPENAKLPILVTLLGMLTEVRLVQPPNAPCPILVTLLGMMILVTGIPANQPDPIAGNPSTKVMLARPVQPVNAPLPILITLLGIFMLVRLVQ